MTEGISGHVTWQMSCLWNPSFLAFIRPIFPELASILLCNREFMLFLKSYGAYGVNRMESNEGMTLGPPSPF